MLGRKVISRIAAPIYRQSVRKMGGGGHHSHPKDGFEGAVRKYLPEDEHLVLAIMGFYASLFLISKATGKKKETVTVTAVAADVSSGSNQIPSVDSAEFDKWISTPGNLERYFESK